MTEQIAAIRNRILPVLHEHGVRQAAVFGSRARGDDRAESDLDLLVEFEPNRSLFDLVGLRLALEDMLEVGVDVVTYRALRQEFREAVLREQVRIL